jgi:endo-1,4-beta-xylanase
MPVTRREFVALPMAAGLSACGGGGGATAATAPLASTLVPSLAQALAPRLSFGAAITPAQLRDAKLAEFIRHHFNALVAENVMKPESLSPRNEGEYTFADADALVDFGVRHGMKVRGHTLVWHVQPSPWMFREGAGEVSRATLIVRLQRYVTDVVSHFKGRIWAWDVVNEAFVFDEPDVEVDADGMRMSLWRRIIGPEYIEIAFRAAAAADPQALLFYNDYETQNPKKVAAMTRLVRDLRAKGVKIDGIGHQMHCARLWPRVADVASAIDTLAALGVQQHVTELDVALNDAVTSSTVTAATPALLDAQAQRYRELVALFLSRRDKVTALLLWGIGDAYSWLTSWPVTRFEAPLLFDTQLNPKPAYHAVIAAAQSTP